MAFFCNRTSIDSTSINTTLQRPGSSCQKIVTSHLDLVAAHEAPNFQVQSEALAHSVCIHTNGRYQTLSGSSVVDKVATITWYAARIVETPTGVELDASILLEMYALGSVGGEEVEGLVLRKVSACRVCVARKERTRVLVCLAKESER